MLTVVLQFKKISESRSTGRSRVVLHNASRPTLLSQLQSSCRETQRVRHKFTAVRLSCSVKYLSFFSCLPRLPISVLSLSVVLSHGSIEPQRTMQLLSSNLLLKASFLVFCKHILILVMGNITHRYRFPRSSNPIHRHYASRHVSGIGLVDTSKRFFHRRNYVLNYIIAR